MNSLSVIIPAAIATGIFIAALVIALASRWAGESIAEQEGTRNGEPEPDDAKDDHRRFN